MSASSDESESVGSAGGGSKAYIRLIYYGRILVTSYAAFIVFYYGKTFGTLSPTHYAVLGFLLTYPHVSRVLEQRYSLRRIGPLAALVDGIAAGLAIYLVSFSLIPAIALASTVTSVNTGFFGIRQLIGGTISLVFGALILVPFQGLNYPPQESLLLVGISSFSIVAYMAYYSLTTFSRSITLKRSRIDLRTQKLAAEMERERANRLVLNVVPARIAEEWQSEGRVAAQARDDVTLFYLDLDGLEDEIGRVAPTELVDRLNHAFRAVDSILSRHRLIRVNSMGSGYLAAAGLFEVEADAPDRAVRAGLEVSAFIADLSRTVEGDGWRPRARIGIHSGQVVSGLVEADRLSYELWGQTVSLVQRIARACPPGDVRVTAKALNGVTSTTWTAVEVPTTEAGLPVLYGVSAAAALEA